jgi:hypothetical protein
MKTPPSKLGITLAGALALTVTTTHADNFGTTGNEFTIDFVNIGNAGNADDTGGSGIYSSPYGGVSYAYRIGVTRPPHSPTPLPVPTVPGAADAKANS